MNRERRMFDFGGRPMRQVNPPVDVVESLGDSWGEPTGEDAIWRIRNRLNANRRVRLYDDRGGLLGKLVAIFAIVLAVFCIVYFAAELLRSAWL